MTHVMRRGDARHFDQKDGQSVRPHVLSARFRYRSVASRNEVLVIGTISEPVRSNPVDEGACCVAKRLAFAGERVGTSVSTISLRRSALFRARWRRHGPSPAGCPSGSGGQSIAGIRKYPLHSSSRSPVEVVVEVRREVGRNTIPNLRRQAFAELDHPLPQRRPAFVILAVRCGTFRRQAAPEPRGKKESARGPQRTECASTGSKSRSSGQSDRHRSALLSPTSRSSGAH